METLYSLYIRWFDVVGGQEVGDLQQSCYLQITWDKLLSILLEYKTNPFVSIRKFNVDNCN
jgi:hypothetical protein